MLLVLEALEVVVMVTQHIQLEHQELLDKDMLVEMEQIHLALQG
jgi:hypothetical protein